MKTKNFFAVLTFLVAISWHSAGATAKITNLFLQKSSQFTELTIECDAPCTFTHQIVEPAANKPFRIVVDVKGALQSLPQRSFTGLPGGSIKQIRTSQYSTDPEKVVRIVLDVTGELTYKTKSTDNSITLYINTPSDKDFPKWSALTGSENQTTAVKTETQVKTESQAKTETPKTMPARPGSEGALPKVATGEKGTNSPTLVAKPIDESKLLNKTTKTNLSTGTDKPALAQTETPKVSPEKGTTSSATPVTPLPKISEPAKKSADVTTKTQSDKQQQRTDQKTEASSTNSGAVKYQTKVEKPATAEKSAATSPVSPSSKPELKRVDSAVAPANRPGTGSPAGEPVDMTKPPKAQKSALPDPKVNKPGKFTETTGSSNALNGNLATSLKGNTPPKVETQDSTGTGATAENNAGTTAPLTKSELVRQKYLANREKGKNPESSITGDSSTLATNSEADKPLSSIDKIRLKYKHGISFVQNDQDEVDQQSQQEAAEEPDDTVAVRSNVGPYSEFLPEREIVVYTTSGRNDPFEPLVEDASTRAQLGQLPDVETLRLVGILQDRRMSRALFQDYNGYSYTLKTGDRVKNGFVLSIEETRVLFQIRQYGWNRQVAIDLDNEK